jgi:hypothetical protein
MHALGRLSRPLPGDPLRMCFAFLLLDPLPDLGAFGREITRVVTKAFDLTPQRLAAKLLQRLDERHDALGGIQRVEVGVDDVERLVEQVGEVHLHAADLRDGHVSVERDKRGKPRWMRESQVVRTRGAIREAGREDAIGIDRVLRPHAIDLRQDVGRADIVPPHGAGLSGGDEVEVVVLFGEISPVAAEALEHLVRRALRPRYAAVQMHDQGIALVGAVVLGHVKDEGPLHLVLAHVAETQPARFDVGPQVRRAFGQLRVDLLEGRFSSREASEMRFEGLVRRIRIRNSCKIPQRHVARVLCRQRSHGGDSQEDGESGLQAAMHLTLLIVASQREGDGGALGELRESEHSAAPRASMRAILAGLGCTEASQACYAPRSPAPVRTCPRETRCSASYPPAASLQPVS